MQEKKKVTNNYQYGIITCPRGIFEVDLNADLKRILQQLILEKDSCNNNQNGSGLELNQSISIKYILPLEEVAGLTLEELSYLPIWKDDKYLFFVMYDTATIYSYSLYRYDFKRDEEPSQYSCMRYIALLDKTYQEEEEIEKVIGNHLKKVYSRLKKANQNRSSTFFIKYGLEEEPKEKIKS